MSLLNPVDTHGNMIHISTGIVVCRSKKDHPMCQSSFYTLLYLLSVSWVGLQFFGSNVSFLSSSLADGDHQWGWSPMGDDSSRWVSRTPPWQSPGLHQNQPPSLHLGKLLGNAPVLISTLCPPDSDGWASKRGEMGLLTSRLFCNVGPTLPSTLVLKGGSGGAKVVDKDWVGLTHNMCS